jgi:hypothetical protein
MLKFIRNLFKRKKHQCNIHNVSHTFIREGKEMTNTKIVTTSRPNIYPAPQPRINCG